MLTQHIFQQEAHHVYNDKGRRMSIYNLLQGWGYLALRNVVAVESTDTVNFIPYSEVI